MSDPTTPSALRPVLRSERSSERPSEQASALPRVGILDSDQLDLRLALRQGCSLVVTYPVDVTELWPRQRCEEAALDDFEDRVNREGWKFRARPTVRWSVDWSVLRIIALVGL